MKLPCSATATKVVRPSSRSIIPFFGTVSFEYIQLIHNGERPTFAGGGYRHASDHQRHRLHAGRQSHPKPPWIAGKLREGWGDAALAGPHHARPRGLHRPARFRLSGDCQRGGSALHPASRRAQGLHPGARRQDAGLRGLPRQPAIHHDRQPRRQRPRLPLPDGLCRAAANKDLGSGSRRRGRCRAAGPPDAGRLSRPAGAGAAVHRRGVGRQLPAAHPAQVRRGRRGGGGRAATDNGEKAP